MAFYGERVLSLYIPGAPDTMGTTEKGSVWGLGWMLLLWRGSTREAGEQLVLTIALSDRGWSSVPEHGHRDRSRWTEEFHLNKKVETTKAMPTRHGYHLLPSTFKKTNGLTIPTL